MSKYTIISKRSQIGNNVRIGNYCIIHDDVIIHDNVEIEDYCTIGYPTPSADGLPLVISNNSHIRSYSLLYQGSVFGENLKTGHRIMVREKTIAGKDLQIGSFCDIEGHSEIGHHVRLHSNVHIGQKSKIHNFVWIYPYVVLTNDPHPPSEGFIEGPEIFDYSVLATMSCILPGVKVGRHALVAAHSLVNRDVKENTVVAGVPAKYLCETKDILLRDGSGSAYPWTHHFHRGYPDSIISEWKKGYYDFEV